MLRNDAMFPVLQMGAVAIGRATVPIDLGAPADRKELLLRESNASAVLTVDDDDVDLSFVPADRPVIRAGLSIAADDRPLPPRTRDLTSPISINFTSGSTGRAKGIVYSERHAMRIVAEHIAILHVNRDDVILGIASLTAAGLRDSITALFTGALLRPLDIKAAGLVESLRVMREERVSMLTFVPSLLRMLMQMPGIETSFQHLRVLELTGEVTTAADIELFRSKLPAFCHIALGFGATETGGIFRWFADAAAIEGMAAPAGYLAHGRTIAILDEDDRPVASGEVGELVVSDEMLALGYWRGGRLDTSRFDPAPGDPGVRTFRTGDRVRIRSDGLAEFAGRIDRMVKVNGLQADLGDIESALKSVDAVLDSAVVAHQREGDNARLVAFVVPHDYATPIDQAMLRRAVAEQTADHMIPHEIRVLEELPRLHNGKPDLVRLTALQGSAA